MRKINKIEETLETIADGLTLINKSENPKEVNKKWKELDKPTKKLDNFIDKMKGTIKKDLKIDIENLETSPKVKEEQEGMFGEVF